MKYLSRLHPGRRWRFSSPFSPVRKGCLINCMTNLRSLEKKIRRWNTNVLRLVVRRVLCRVFAPRFRILPHFDTTDRDYVLPKTCFVFFNSLKRFVRDRFNFNSFSFDYYFIIPGCRGVGETAAVPAAANQISSIFLVYAVGFNC